MSTFKDFLKKRSKNKKNKLLTPVKRPKGAKKGGYPYGTKPGHGGLAFGGVAGGFGGDGGGGGESVDLSDLPMIQEVRFDPHPENEEQPIHNKSFRDIQPNNHDLSMKNDQDSIFDDEEKEDDHSDPNRQGLIRRVPGAHLVYKRQGEDGTYHELWLFPIESDMRDERDIKSAILAGTDVDPQTSKSEDDEQEYELWTAGNAQMMLITGLPN